MAQKALRYTRWSPSKRKRAHPWDDRAVSNTHPVRDQAAIRDLATATLRQGLSTAIVSSDAINIGAGRDDSRLPEDCCM
jgi:hypothetical protein